MKQFAIRSFSCYTKSLANAVSRDFFGISNLTTKDVAGTASETKLPCEQITKKYQPLLQPRNRKENEEKHENMIFGTFRFDVDNVARSHGQYEPTNDKKMFDTIDVKQRFVPTTDDGLKQIADIKITQDPSDTEIDSGFFEDVQRRLHKLKSDETIKLDESPSKPRIKRKARLRMDQTPDQNKPQSQSMDDNFKLSGHKMSTDELKETIAEADLLPDKKEPLRYNPKEDLIPLHELDPKNEEYHSRHDNVIKDDEFDKKIDEEYDVKSGKYSVEPMSAHDHLKNLRSRKAEPKTDSLKENLHNSEEPYPKKLAVKLDSQGYRDYSNQVTDWRKLRHVEILEIIRSSVVYNNYGILAINKPYGIASHDDEKSREFVDMNSLVGELAKSLRIDKVHLAHRLDKTTTGIIVFATSQAVANKLNKQFKSGEIKKTYWCITRGIPDPPEAIIDIPISEFKVAGKLRSCVAPEFLSEESQISRDFQKARRAITEYKVLSSNKLAALVEVKPRTGVKHQIRCHLSFGLNRPILGDHKYSHLSKIAPQLLPQSMLHALHLRQTKVRTLPVHLHAKSIVIPGAKANGESLHIHAPLPQFFYENLVSLGLLSETIKPLVAK